MSKFGTNTAYLLYIAKKGNGIVKVDRTLRKRRKLIGEIHERRMCNDIAMSEKL